MGNGLWGKNCFDGIPADGTPVNFSVKKLVSPLLGAPVIPVCIAIVFIVFGSLHFLPSSPLTKSSRTMGESSSSSRLLILVSPRISPWIAAKLPDRTAEHLPDCLAESIRRRTASIAFFARFRAFDSLQLYPFVCSLTASSRYPCAVQVEGILLREKVVPDLSFLFHAGSCLSHLLNCCVSPGTGKAPNVRSSLLDSVLKRLSRVDWKTYGSKRYT